MLELIEGLFFSEIFLILEEVVLIALSSLGITSALLIKSYLSDKQNKSILIKIIREVLEYSDSEQLPNRDISLRIISKLSNKEMRKVNGLGFVKDSGSKNGGH